MGVGVFTSDFEQTGVTFMLSPDFYLTDGEYAGYQEACEADGNDPLDKDEWERQTLNDYEIDAGFVILSAAQKLSKNTKWLSHRTDSFPADSSFFPVCSSTEFIVGTRSWESDYVIGIVPIQATRELLINGEEYDGQCLEQTGQTLDDLRNNTETAIEIVKDVVIQALINEGYKCRYRTSGYTTASYEKIDDFSVDAKATEYYDTFTASAAPGLR